MASEFERSNLQHQVDFPLETAYTDNGENIPTSIERFNNSEDATETIFRRPAEQLRIRSRHLQEEANSANEFMHAIQGRFLDMRGATVQWHGLTPPIVPGNAGVFSLTSSLFVTHPMYPDSVYEIPAAIIGNASTGFFQYEYNRLLNEGDSLWVTWGSTTDPTATRDLAARPAPGGPGVVTQPQLRKGPTWVMIQETVLDLSLSAIVPGSDKIRIYADPIGAPLVYLERVIRDIAIDTDGYWYVEVAHDAPLFDSAKVIPPAAPTQKLYIAAGGAEYEIVDTTGAIVRVAQRGFSKYISNLWWFKAGRVDPLVPYAAPMAPVWRENEWEFAIPLAVVSNGQLFFPLAAAGGLTANETQFFAPAGFVRTTVADNIYAAHTWAIEQFYQQAAGSDLLTFMTTSSAIVPGRGRQTVILEEAHTDGLTSVPIYWASPARPARFGLLGNADAQTNPYVRLVEQGFYTVGGAEEYKECSMDLRKQAVPGAPAGQGTTYNRLTASQLPYITRADRIIVDRHATTDAVTNAWLNGLAASPFGQPLLTAALDFGNKDTYENRVGLHDVRIEGYLSFREVFPWWVKVTGPPAGFPDSNYWHSFSIPFWSELRLTPDAIATNPKAISVSARAPRLHKRTLVFTGQEDAAPIIVPYVKYGHQVIEAPSVEALPADFGAGTNDLYPTVPAAGGTVIYDALLSSDIAIFEGAAMAYYPRFSQVEIKVIAVPTYVATNQYLELFAQLEFRVDNSEVDALQVNRQNNHMFVDTFKGLSAIGGFSPILAPAFESDLTIRTEPVWV